jgi:hypothetical protein
MTVALLPLSAATYEQHALHRSERVWDQTNCSVDAWIEVLHALGLDPLAAGAFSVATDFEGDQWTFYKYPEEDLWNAYGVDVHEMNPWRPVLEQVCEQLALGRFMTVEVDSWFLPDTHGVAYRLAHTKSTIVANTVDRSERFLGYFHNSGYYELSGDDFDGVFRLGVHADPAALAPYTEIVRLEKMSVLPPQDLTATSLAMLRKHLGLRPADNPVERMAARIDADTPWLRSSGSDAFHDYAFATVRQCGASAETASSYCNWLADRVSDNDAALKDAAVHWRALAEAAKAAQLKLARLARGRSPSLDESWRAMAEHWAAAQHHLDALGDP